MPRRRQDDRSPGDARQPYSDLGGPEGRHAQTHDVRREALTNPRGPEPETGDFDSDLGSPAETSTGGGHADESSAATADKRLQGRLQELSADELSRLSVLEEGARLDQGSTYLDLNHLERGPFKAIGGQAAEPGNRYVSKHDTDHELWNRLVGDQEPRVERPT